MPAAQHYVRRFQALGSACELQLAADPARASGIADACVAEVQRIETKYSRYRPDSVTSTINCNAGLRPTALDPETNGLLSYAAVAHQQSQGLFDITSGVLRRVWQFKQPQLPDPAHIEALLPLIGWANVVWDGTQLFLPKLGMEIDFGGIGKEYAVDRIADLCLAAGCTGGLLNLGGDLRAIGPQSDGRPWAIGIVHPRQPGASVATLVLETGALATSGDYERAIVVHKRRYCHILDPRTGWPVVDSFQSVTVCAPRCLVAGTLATTAMLLGEQKGLALLRSNVDRWLAVAQDGSLVHPSDGANKL